MRLPIRIVPVVLALAAVLTACSSNDPIRFPTLSFEPSANPAPMTVVVREGAEIGSDLVEVEVVVTGVSDVFATDLNMAYDPSVVRFLNFSTVGTVLGSDGTQTNGQINEQIPGSLLLGLTRTASTTGVDIDNANTERLFTMQFLLIGSSGSTVLGLNDDCLLDSSTPPVPITGVTCTGGTFRID